MHISFTINGTIANVTCAVPRPSLPQHIEDMALLNRRSSRLLRMTVRSDTTGGAPRSIEAVGPTQSDNAYDLACRV